MVAKRPSGTTEVLCADSRAQAAPACLCSSALLPLPLPPSALHPQTQKHSSPGLSPAACSSPGFAARRTAPQSCQQQPVCSKWPKQYPDTAGFSSEEWDNLQKNTAHLDPGDLRVVLQACLKQLITEERGQRGQRESCQAALGTARIHMPSKICPNEDNPFQGPLTPKGWALVLSGSVRSGASLPQASVGTDRRDTPPRLTDPKHKQQPSAPGELHAQELASPLCQDFLLPSQGPPCRTASCDDCSCLRPLSGVLRGPRPYSCDHSQLQQ